MTRVSLCDNPFLLGFDRLERALDRVSKTPADGYPPYNVEQTAENAYLITLAVAGFGREELAITVERTQLTIRGKQSDDARRMYLHRGIAARQFQRTFVLADGIDVVGAELRNGLLHIDLVRPESGNESRSIEIRAADDPSGAAG